MTSGLPQPQNLKTSIVSSGKRPKETGHLGSLLCTSSFIFSECQSFSVAGGCGSFMVSPQAAKPVVLLRGRAALGSPTETPTASGTGPLPAAPPRSKDTARRGRGQG